MAEIRTEIDLWKRIRPFLVMDGFPVRVENVLSQGMPDVTYATKKGNIFIELKIEHAGKIKLEDFQLPFMMQCLEWLPDGMYWFCVARSSGAIHYFTGREILKGEQILMKSGLHVSLTGLTPSALAIGSNSLPTPLQKG